MSISIYRKHQLLIALCMLFCASDLFALSTQTTVQVNCSVVRKSDIKIGVIQMPEIDALMKNNLLLKDIKVNCPIGTVATVSIHTEISPHSPTSKNVAPEKACPIDSAYQFYKDYACTEVWQPDEQIKYDGSSSVNMPAIFCKKIGKTITPKNGDPITLFIISIDY